MKTTFSFDEDLTEYIENTVRIGESKSDALRRAIVLLNVVERGRAEGKRLFLIDAGTRQEIEL